MRLRTIALVLVTASLVSVAAACSGGDSAGDARGGGSGDPSNVTTADDVVAPDPACDGSTESPDTRFIVDDCGRVVILRGVNVESASKGEGEGESDHLPVTRLEDQRHLGSWGWNTVRFLVFWGAIEPTEGHYDDAYLKKVQRWLDWYADHGVHVVLDMHQDLYSWKTNGNGAPDWAVDTRGLEVKPIEEGQPWYLQGADPGVQAAYQSFWNPTPDQRDLKPLYLGALNHLVEELGDHPAVIGFDVMNEPAFANGDLNATLALQGDAAAGKFHNENLTRFTQGAIDAVRKADPDTWVFVEPTSLINAFPYPGDLIFDELTDPREGPPRLVYAGHLYDPNTHDGNGYLADDPYVDTWQKYRTAEAEQMDAALWIGEWGGSLDQKGMPRYITDVTSMADEEMIGWAWWSWDPGGWGPVDDDGRNQDDSLSMSEVGEALLRVQPRAVAGTPTSFAWDGETFTMAWDERSDAKGATEIAVPSRLFSPGIDVVLDDEPLTELDWNKRTGVLRIAADRKAKAHTICITEKGGSGCES